MDTSATSLPQADASTTTDPTNVTIQKLKDNVRVVVDKLNEVCKVNTIMLQKLQKLTEENETLRNNHDDIYDDLYDHKVEITGLNQYGRRENVEFVGIPESFSQDKLQAHITTVLKSMGINNITGKDVHNLHRIGKRSPTKPRNVIVRFVNRKTAFATLKNKKKLKSGEYKHYYVIENLCPYNKKIFNTCYRHKKNKELHSVWTYNGNVFVKVHEGGDRVQVEHLDDIDNLFDDEDNESVENDGDDDDNGANSGGNSNNSNSNNDNLPDDVNGGNSGSNSDNTFPDHPDNYRNDHVNSTPNFGNLGFSDSTKRNRRRSSNFQARQLSLVAEVDTDAESSILRTPIPPLVIQI